MKFVEQGTHVGRSLEQTPCIDVWEPFVNWENGLGGQYNTGLAHINPDYSKYFWPGLSKCDTKTFHCFENSSRLPQKRIRQNNVEENLEVVSRQEFNRGDFQENWQIQSCLNPLEPPCERDDVSSPPIWAEEEIQNFIQKHFQNDESGHPHNEIHISGIAGDRMNQSSDEIFESGMERRLRNDFESRSPYYEFQLGSKSLQNTFDDSDVETFTQKSSSQDYATSIQETSPNSIGGNVLVPKIGIKWRHDDRIKHPWECTKDNSNNGVSSVDYLSSSNKSTLFQRCDEVQSKL